MLNIRIICIGKLKEVYWRDAVREYEKRLAPYCKLEIVELKEARLPVNAGEALEGEVRAAESAAVLAAAGEIGGASHMIALDQRGRQYSSPEFAARLAALAGQGKSRVSFLIGGSLGFSEAVRRTASELLSFSEMTFTHQMMRPILLEQLYRAFKINSGEKYHK